MDLVGAGDGGDDLASGVIHRGDGAEIDLLLGGHPVVCRFKLGFDLSGVRLQAGAVRGLQVAGDGVVAAADSFCILSDKNWLFI